MAISPDDPLAYRLGVRAREPLNTAGQFVSDLTEVGGYGLASGTAGLLDLALRTPRQFASTAENIGAGLRGAPAPAAYDPYRFQRAVESWGVPDAAYRWGIHAFPQEGQAAAAAPAPSGGPVFIDGTAGMDIAPPAPQLAPIFIDGTAGMNAAPPALAAPTAPGPTATTVTLGAPGAAASAAPAAPAARQMLGLDAVQPEAVRVTTNVGGLPVPMRCQSGVCQPDIRSGNFYANAEQSAVARNAPFGATAWDRMGGAALQQVTGLGPASVAQYEQAQRAQLVNDLRLSPQYDQVYQAMLANSGNDRQLAQSLADQYFVGQDPRLNLALTETDTSQGIDEASSRRAALALETGDATLSNQLTQAAQGAGYYGAAGGLPYGLAPDQPGIATPGGIAAGLPNQPEVYGAPASATAGGVAASIARRDAANRGIQAANASSSAALIQQLRLIDQLERNSLDTFEERERIRAQYRRDTGAELSNEQLTALIAQAAGRVSGN